MVHEGTKEGKHMVVKSKHEMKVPHGTKTDMLNCLYR